MGHDHSHHHHSKVNNILLAFALNAGFAILEFFGGILTNSVAIMSDALHDLGDSLALLISYFAEKFSKKAADEKYTFGYKRFSLLSALLNGTILVVGSVFVISEAVARLNSPEVVKPEGMIYLAIVGIAVNSFAAYRLSKDEGLNVKMLMYHLLEDLLGWAAILIVSIILIFKPWYILDSIMSILISLTILRGVLKNLVKVGKIFVQQFPENVEREKLLERIKLCPGVKDVHYFQGWSLDESTINVTLHVVVDENMRIGEADKVRKQIEAFLQEAQIAMWTIQIESDGDECVNLQTRP